MKTLQAIALVLGMAVICTAIASPFLFAMAYFIGGREDRKRSADGQYEDGK